MNIETILAVLNLPIVGVILSYVVRIESRLVRLETIESERARKDKHE